MGLMFLAEFLRPSTEGSWWNYPGLELWKFLNLVVFVAAGSYLIRRPLKDGFLSRREGIRRRFLEGRAQLDEALSKLAIIESRLARIESEVGAIKLQSRAEAAAERDRIVRETEAETKRFWQRAERDVERVAKAARRETQRAAAQDCVRLAEQMLRSGLNAEDDARLIMLGVEELRRSAN